ncbi:hypothetical protein A3715_03425 [Oleiphilus sp. HI0009]|uniref:hypothetical protein n=2 Tax=Oleiphilus TaxID=141450 RepID=UPI0007C303CF|nr:MULTISPECIES: hypothetical protein [unclassified Oleiphilus]KZX86463.1 hypothetical protein A3715_03425 [Oleiphilus sp. HI0009]KZY70494.1 hypothetical protein A3739_06600 [Oleiphilus sp. HI0067]KZY71675.1 hypothetical protein A3738_14620 [Oleiphilus sp. HI0066]
MLTILFIITLAFVTTLVVKVRALYKADLQTNDNSCHKETRTRHREWMRANRVMMRNNDETILEYINSLLDDKNTGLSRSYAAANYKESISQKTSSKPYPTSPLKSLTDDTKDWIIVEEDKIPELVEIRKLPHSYLTDQPRIDKPLSVNDMDVSKTNIADT